MLTKQMIRDGLQYYRWETDYPLHTTTDSMNDFIYNHLPEDCEITEVDANQIVVDMDGDKYKITAYGAGDFCNHEVSIYEAKS
jgi:hypothetical protein